MFLPFCGASLFHPSGSKCKGHRRASLQALLWGPRYSNQLSKMSHNSHILGWMINIFPIWLEAQRTHEKVAHVSVVFQRNGRPTELHYQSRHRGVALTGHPCHVFLKRWPIQCPYEWNLNWFLFSTAIRICCAFRIAKRIMLRKRSALLASTPWVFVTEKNK